MHRNYYAIIPANVRYDKDLKPGAKLLYGEITALCNEKGYCWAGNGYFAELYDKDKSTIARWIQQLKSKGYITIIGDKDIVKKLKSKNMKGLGFGDKICEWCGVYTSVLHKHHYPIPKSKGGTKVVNICPNCHNEFHYHKKKIQINLPEKELKSLLKVRSEKNAKII